MGLEQRSLEWYNKLDPNDLDLIKQRASNAYQSIADMMYKMDTPRPSAPVTLIGTGTSNSVFDLDVHRGYNLALRLPLEPDPHAEYFGFEHSVVRKDMQEFFDTAYPTSGIVIPVLGKVRGKKVYSLLIENLAKGRSFEDHYDHQFAVVDGEKYLIDPEWPREPVGTYEGPIITL